LMAFILAIFLNERTALWVGLFTAILKELMDRANPKKHTADGLDFISGMCGTCFGVLMSEGL